MLPDNGPSLPALLAEGYLAPRRSMARVLALKPDERTRLIMVGVSIAASTLGFALIGRPESAIGQGGVIFGYVVTILAGLLQYYGFAWIIGLISRAMGGEGDREADRTLVAWWALVTAPLPVAMIAAIQSGQSPFAALVLLGSAILSLVLLAAYITEAHKFRSTMSVCGMMIGLLMVFSMVLTSLVPLPA